MANKSTPQKIPNFPTFFVVTRKMSESSLPIGDDDEEEESRRRIEKQWNDMWGGKPPGPIFVLPPGADFDIATDD